MATIFPLVRTEKAQHFGSNVAPHVTRRTPNERVSVVLPIPPRYATESAVTAAIAAGTFKGFAASAYAEARRYEAAVKAASKRSR